ncbi:MAG TPA: neutral zinc metallopeptidase, partial [Gemmatimonadaceae bacterium]|nr:neutral zinc metallopeptidase [Gemmatimonadaceae bacterium]
EEVWTAVFQEEFGQDYPEPRLVLFSGATGTACGTGQSAMGPFYCPLDQQVYIDLSFYQELEQRLGAGGDFAQAYVIAHELGHHVQHILGTDARVRQLQESRPGQANELSVRLELQADCYAGVWGRSTGERKLLEQGDIEEGLGAASAVGDDRLQRASTGSVHPESFTHGTSAQRATWFKRGLESGNPESCDTFAGGR